MSPEPLNGIDLAAYVKFEGGYSNEEETTTHQFAIEDQTCTWQDRDRDPTVFLPAGDSEDGEMTIEFLMDESGEVTAVEERKVRRRRTIRRKP